MADKEGVIKFSYLLEGSRDDFSRDLELIYWRDFLWRQHLIGVDEKGYGFGNVSIRLPKGFLITGSQTGHLPTLRPAHLVHIIDWDFHRNQVIARGEWKPSSESLTHAAAYEAAPDAAAVVHAHHLPAWQALKGRYPTTDEQIPYGTVAMAEAIMRLLRNQPLPAFIVMGGHKGGLLTVAPTLAQAAILMAKTVAPYNF